MAKKNNSYEWFDEREYSEIDGKLLIIADVLGRHKCDWREQWLEILPEDYGNFSPLSGNTPLIYKDIFDNVCRQRGIMMPADGQPLDPDFATLARTEAKITFAPIRAALLELGSRSPAAFVYGAGKQIDLPLFFYIDGKRVVLREDYKTNLKALCTHAVPEKDRELLDFAVSNCETLRKLYDKFNHGDMLLSFLNWISTNEPTAQSFGRWFE